MPGGPIPWQDLCKSSGLQTQRGSFRDWLQTSVLGHRFASAVPKCECESLEGRKRVDSDAANLGCKSFGSNTHLWLSCLHHSVLPLHPTAASSVLAQWFHSLCHGPHWGADLVVKILLGVFPSFRQNQTSASRKLALPLPRLSHKTLGTVRDPDQANGSCLFAHG